MTGTAAHPLAGMRVLVPRATAGADPLVIALSATGGEPVVVPLIQTVAPDDPTELDDTLLALDAGYYAWVVVTSGASVAVLVDRADETGLALPALLESTQVAAVGPATARALRDAGVRVDLVPSGSSSVADLLAAWPALPSGAPARARAGGAATDGSAARADVPDDDLADAAATAVRVLLPHADRAVPTLAAGLRARGWTVDEVVAYRTVPGPAPDDETRADWAAGRFGAVVLTSGSTARHLLELLGPVPPTTLVACIGPSTATVAHSLGLTVDAIALTQTPTGIVAALVAAVTAARTTHAAQPPTTPTEAIE